MIRIRRAEHFRKRLPAEVDLFRRGQRKIVAGAARISPIPAE